MSKKFIFIWAILVSIVVLGCQHEEADSHIGEDKLMNIIDSNNNIKSIELNGQAKTFKLEDIIDIVF